MLFSFCSATKVFSEIMHGTDLITPPPELGGGIFYLVFYGMEEFSAHYKYILI